MINQLVEAPFVSEIVYTDDFAVPWTTTDHPAVIMESERSPIEMTDGSLVRPRAVVLRTGFAIDDVASDPDSPVYCCREDYEPAMAAIVRLVRSERDVLRAQIEGVFRGGVGLPRASSPQVSNPTARPRPPADAMPPTAPTPISTWLSVATAVGVDDSTIRAHRRRTQDGHGPYFGSDDEARSWYAAMVSSPTHVPGKGRTRKPKRAPEISVPVDWSKVKV